MFTFTRLPPSQWRSLRATNAIERLHEEFKRRIKTQTVLPSADTAAMLFWALFASGQINMRKVDGGRRSPQHPQPIDLAAPHQLQPHFARYRPPRPRKPPMLSQHNEEQRVFFWRAILVSQAPMHQRTLAKH